MQVMIALCLKEPGLQNSLQTLCNPSWFGLEIWLNFQE